MYLKQGLFLCLFLCAIALSANEKNIEQNWTRIGDRHGIKFYKRPIQGNGFMEFMGVTVIDEKMEVIGELFRDIDSFPRWITNCHSASVIKRYSRNILVLHMILSPPLISKREIVLKNGIHFNWDLGRALITITTTEEIAVPVKRGHVKVTKMRGAFELEYLGRDKTKCIYRLMVDPAGSIPKKIAYAVMQNYPYETLKKLKGMLSDDKYSEAAQGTKEEKVIESMTKNESLVRRILSNRLLKFVGDKDSMKKIINSDREAIRSIMQSGGSYDSVEKATVRFFAAYMEMFVKNPENLVRLKNNQKMFVEFSDMIMNECGAGYLVFEQVLEKYYDINKK